MLVLCTVLCAILWQCRPSQKVRQVYSVALNNMYTTQSGVTLIAKFCVNIAFSGAVLILATPMRHHMQNDITPIEQVMVHCGCYVTQHKIYLKTQVSSKTTQLHS